VEKVELLKYSIILKSNIHRDATGIARLMRRNGKLHINVRAQNLKSRGYKVAITFADDGQILGDMSMIGKGVWAGEFTLANQGDVSEASVYIIADKNIILSGHVNGQENGVIERLLNTKSEEQPIEQKTSTRHETQEKKQESSEKSKDRSIVDIFLNNDRLETLEQRLPQTIWVESGEGPVGLMYRHGEIEYILRASEVGRAIGAEELEKLEKLLPASEDKETEIQTYYERNREEIEGIFTKGQPVEELEELLPDSRWVWVEDEASYVMGIIYDIEGNPQYICYGVPSAKSSQPPQGMDHYCQWLGVGDDGYWMMYQDAMTGHTVEPN
jgi:hypothetical protein